MRIPYLPRSAAAPALIAGLALSSSPRAEPELPMGPETSAVPVAHFPSPAHAVIWRNWSLVAPARLASALGAPEAEVREVAVAMGLASDPAVAPEWHRRGYITVVRRNWHLLPYEQILTLLDMKAGELSFALREDDFLFVKLGLRKPRCAAVRLPERFAAIRAAEARIGRVVGANFPDATAAQAEPPFGFVKKLSALPAGDLPPPPADWRRAPPRFIYSYFATFGDPLADATLSSYPDGLLVRLAAEGANGVWLHAVLRQLAPGGPDFPEFGEGHAQRLENLRRLVERAAARGVAVYLYLNEPRAMPAGFFAGRSEMAGVAESDHRALCTSDPRVRRWLEAACAHVFSEVPGLGGVVTISASENLTHCASHGGQSVCPRCYHRDPDEVIAEVNAVMAAGVHRAAPEARFFVWDWGWHGHGHSPGVISRLPKDTWLLSVSEWDAPYQRGGIAGKVGEYSLSVGGPGPRARRHWELARAAGLQTAAKVQLNITWELASVPWLPVVDLVAKHCEALSREKVGGLMLSWSLGGHPSPNLQVARRFFDRADRPPSAIDEVLEAVATERYGPAATPSVREAWRQFSTAFAEFPYSGATVYSGPQHLGPANLPSLDPTGLPATMVGFPYDDLEAWRGPYPAPVFASQFDIVAAGWAQGVALLDKALGTARGAGARGDQITTLAEDLRLARAAGLHFASAAEQTRFLLARRRWLAAPPGSPERSSAATDLRRHLQMLAAHARALFPLAQADSRIGFEASNHYFYRPHDLLETVIAAEWLGEQLARQ